VPPDLGAGLARKGPVGRFVTFPALGHLLFWEDADGFAEVAASFLLGSDGARTDSGGFRDL
jgi:pimeloyl-ACP methyl ester carboxylesterase